MGNEFIISIVSKAMRVRSVSSIAGVRFCGLWAALVLAATVVFFADAQPTPKADAKKSPPQEVERSDKQKKPSKVIHVPEADEADPNEKANGRQSGQPIPTLDQAAKQTDEPTLQRLYRDLAVPYDLVTWKNGHETRVAPISEYLGSTPGGQGSVSLQFFDDKWKLGSLHNIAHNEIARVDHFEAIVLEKIDRFLKGNQQPASKQRVPDLQREQAAEVVFAGVLGWHESQPARSGRKVEGWADLEKNLRHKLLDVQLDQLKQLAITKKNWEESFALSVRLSKAYPDRDIQKKLAQQMVPLLEQPLGEEKYSEARRRLQALDDLFPNSPALTPITNRLREKATELLARAKSEKDTDKARQLLDQVQAIDPRLPGLKNYRLQRVDASFTPLGIGVHELPENLSPATAVTDSERQAIELLFESLIKIRYDSVAGECYEPCLASRQPSVIPLGREFELIRDAYWSNGEQLTAMDVRQTLELLRRPDWTGYSPAWASMLAVPPPSKDGFRIGLTLRQGYLEPLSLMDFKILPAAGNLLDRPDSDQFRRQPIGSGPFQYQGRKEDRAYGEYAQFSLNPYYHRAGKPDQPHIREVRFFRPKNPAADFEAGRLHLLWEPSDENLQRVHSLATIETLPNRRIYFLAVNHRGSSALGNRDLRKLLAHAIDREKILKDVFRREFKDQSQPPHRPLNGPYPPDSWACNDHLKKDPFDPQLAKSLAESVKASNATLKLTLKFPEDDPRVRQACETIRDAVAALGTGIDIELLGRSPRQLHREVELEHDYQLAYYHYDFPSETYWLWPLFDSNRQAMDRGGPNFLGYENDSELEREFRQAMDHREFARIREYTHNIHEIMYEKMPFIPLWQLDTVVATHGGLKTVHLDPLLLFNDVGEWQLERK